VPTLTDFADLTKEQRTRAELEAYPLLSYYFSHSWSDLATMPRPLMAIYLDQLPKILAQDQMTSMETSAYPHMKRGDQRRLFRRLQRTLDQVQAVKPKTEEQRLDMARAVGVNVVIEGEEAEAA
jgi:hypothetical protein